MFWTRPQAGLYSDNFGRNTQQFKVQTVLNCVIKGPEAEV